jgi:hypothetical protein
MNSLRRERERDRFPLGYRLALALASWSVTGRHVADEGDDAPRLSSLACKRMITHRRGRHRDGPSLVSLTRRDHQTEETAMRTTTKVLRELVTKTVRVQKGDVMHEGVLVGQDADFVDEGTRDWIVFWVDGETETEFRFKANAGWSVTVL